MTDKMITPRARLAYAHLFKAKPQKQGDPKYQAVLIFDAEAQKTDAYKALKKAAADAAKAKWGDKIPKNLKTPFKDAADMEDKAGFEAGMTFINVSSKQQPGLVDQRVQPITDQKDLYSGCYVRASIRAYAYDQEGNRGVSFGLNNIQKLADGERLGGGPSRAEDDFDAVEGGGGSKAEDDGSDIFG